MTPINENALNQAQVASAGVVTGASAAAQVSGATADTDALFEHIANPAAGAEVILTVPDGYWWRVVSGHLTFVSSSAVASRAPSYQINTGTFTTPATAEVWASDGPATIAASSFVEMLFAEGEVPGASLSASQAGVWQITLPKIWLPPGYRLQTNTGSLQAGDQYSNVNFIIAQKPGAGPASSLPNPILVD